MRTTIPQINKGTIKGHTCSRASSINVLTSEETMGKISFNRFSYRAKRRDVAVRSSAVLKIGNVNIKPVWSGGC